MSSSNRLFVVAVRGFLIAGFLLAPIALTAQEKPEEQTPPIEQSKGATEHPPTPKNETAKAPEEQKAPATKTLPAAPVQGERPAEPACDARCQAAEQREKDGLKAQQTIAAAADDLIIVMWWQFGAGIIVLIALFFTLKYTRDTARAADDAVKETRQTAERQLRAYVFIHESVRWQRSLTDPWVVRLKIKNFGQTAAYGARLRIKPRFAGALL